MYTRESKVNEYNEYEKLNEISFDAVKIVKKNIKIFLLLNITSVEKTEIYNPVPFLHLLSIGVLR